MKEVYTKDNIISQETFTIENLIKKEVYQRKLDFSKNIPDIIYIYQRIYNFSKTYTRENFISEEKDSDEMKLLREKNTSQSCHFVIVNLLWDEY